MSGSTHIKRIATGFAVTGLLAAGGSGVVASAAQAAPNLQCQHGALDWHEMNSRLQPAQSADCQPDGNYYLHRHGGQVRIVLMKSRGARRR